MKVLITIVLIYLVICLLCFLNKCFQKLKLSPVRTLCASDDRLKGAKIFGNTIKTPIAINEAGYIGFVLRGSKFVFSIKDVNGFNVTIDEREIARYRGNSTAYARRNKRIISQTNTSGTISKETKIHGMELLFKINNFNTPTVAVPLLSHTITKGSFFEKMLTNEITELTGTLKVIERLKHRA